jgi:hypothetical protein
MPHEPEPFHESSLNSVEYREKLMRKLNCLIAVLEVASAKVKRSLAGPAPDVSRLEKIQANLTNTLEVCRRARRALERKENLPEDLSANLNEIVRKVDEPRKRSKAAAALPQGARIEMSSSAEHSRFEKLGRIRAAEISGCDLDDLARRLQES